MVFPPTFPSKTLCFAIKVKMSGCTKLPLSTYVYINSGPSRHETESMIRVNDGSLFLMMHEMASSRASSTALTERSVRRHRCSVKVATTLLSVALTPHFRRAARASFSHAFCPFSSQSVRRKLAQLSLFACGFFLMLYLESVNSKKLWLGAKKLVFCPGPAKNCV